MAELDGFILEGFICPLCKADCRTLLQLEAHFSEEHEETTRSKLKANIKNFLGKARTLGRRKHADVGVDEGAAAVSTKDGGGTVHVTNVSGIDPDYWPSQEFGHVRNYTREFKKLRDARISQTVVETNRIVIRLEKLFQLLKDDHPRTLKQVKVVEKNVVPWKPDDEEKRCMKCGRSFGVRRRKHHCRLCGDIICKLCSRYISHSEAYVLLSDSPNYRALAPSPSLTRARKLRLLKKGRKSGEGRHYLDDDRDEEDSEDIRMCPTCDKLIERQLLHLQRQEKPLLVALYEKMQLTMEEVERKKPAFLEMAESLLSGDHCYTLQATNRKRRELVRLYECIDSISKDVLILASSGDEFEPGSQRCLKLCQGIRRYASMYLQDSLLILPKLPTEEKLQELREAREREAQERIEELERQRELLRQQEAVLGAGVTTPSKDDEVFEASTTTTTTTDGFEASLKVREKGGVPIEKKRFEKLRDFSTKVVSFKKDLTGGKIGGIQRSDSTSGWMCESTALGTSLDSQDDPFALQRQRLLEYIQQARKAKRMDEVHALEASLRDIEVAMHEEQAASMSYGLTLDI